MSIVHIPSIPFNRFAFFAFPLVLATSLAAQTPPPIQDPVLPVVSPAPAYCVNLTKDAAGLPVVFTLAPCPSAANMTIAVAPPPEGGVGVHAVPTSATPTAEPALCATPVDPALLQIIHDILDTPQPTATPAPAPAGQ